MAQNTITLATPVLFVKSILIVFDMSEDWKCPVPVSPPTHFLGVNPEDTPDAPATTLEPDKPNIFHINIAKKARDKQSH